MENHKKHPIASLQIRCQDTIADTTSLMQQQPSINILLDQLYTISELLTQVEMMLTKVKHTHHQQLQNLFTQYRNTLLQLKRDLKDGILQQRNSTDVRQKDMIESYFDSLGKWTELLYGLHMSQDMNQINRLIGKSLALLHQIDYLIKHCNDPILRKKLEELRNIILMLQYELEAKLKREKQLDDDDKTLE